MKLQVEDTGIGMSQEEQNRLFKRFSQANSRTSQVCFYSFYYHYYYCNVYSFIIFIIHYLSLSKEYGGSGLGLAVSLS